MIRHCSDCERPLSRWTQGGRCRSCTRRERLVLEAIAKYRGDMALLSFLREGGTQLEWAEAHGVTRAAISAGVPRARARVDIVTRLRSEGDPRVEEF